jgi:hypothetical protein
MPEQDKPQTRAQRQERVAALRQAQSHREHRGRVRFYSIIGVAVIAAVGGISAAVINAGSANRPGVDATRFSGLTRNHVTTPVDYPQTPPVGGDHDPVWLNCGIYNAPVRTENAVHSLEHGAVWLTYRPDLPAGQLDRLRDVVRGRKYTILSPYPDLPAPVVVSAWGVQRRFTDPTDPQIAAFMAAYGNARTAPEPRAPCTGGLGTPTG